MQGVAVLWITYLSSIMRIRFMCSKETGENDWSILARE
jgi:hypothetical protein